MIKREKYLKQIRPFYKSDLVKVLVGIRRCGKSVILESIMSEISLKTNNIIYLNFENTSDFLKASTPLALVKYVNENRKEGKCYVFLDEIQEIDGWQIAIKDLRLQNNSLFITGSNSKLLSKEILTLLSGRFVSFRIRPFVYKEILEFGRMYNKEILKPADYLVWGGFPGRLNIDNLEATKIFLTDLENTIVFNDLIKRYRINKTASFVKLVNYILKSNSRIYSARSIHKYLTNQCEDISLNTVIKFITYLKDAYIIDEIPQYSSKAKKELAYYGKIYNSDVAFNSLRADNNRYDIDHNLENIVYNELLYMGYSMKIAEINGKEIDFIANKDNKSYFIQVAYSVVDDKAYKREFAPYSDLDNSNQKILITNDEIDFSTSTVRHIQFKDFLLMEDFVKLS